MSCCALWVAQVLPDAFAFLLSHAWEIFDVGQDVLGRGSDRIQLGLHLGFHGVISHAIASEDGAKVLGAALP